MKLHWMWSRRYLYARPMMTADDIRKLSALLDEYGEESSLSRAHYLETRRWVPYWHVREQLRLIPVSWLVRR